MNGYSIRQALMGDLHHIEEIYAYARAFMAKNGNPTQWGTEYPQRKLLEEDIEKNRLYVVTREGKIRGVFMFSIGPDPTYAVIEDGKWHTGNIYGVIHRIAGDGSGGIFPAVLGFCRERCRHIRIDTHENNLVMQHVVEKAGFRRCGIIYTHNGTPRIAYDFAYKTASTG